MTFTGPGFHQEIALWHITSVKYFSSTVSSSESSLTPSLPSVSMPYLQYRAVQPNLENSY